MNWNFPYRSTRLPILAANCVATTQPLAAQAGLQMLARGGNAVDAALAAAIALTVVEPTMNGIGGDAFALVWDGHALHGLNASGRAPRAWTSDRFADGPMPDVGWDSVTVPGGVSGWVALHEKFGRLPFEDLFEPALRYAQDGFLVPYAISRIWQNQVQRLAGQPGFAEVFLPNGRAPLPGERFRCPDQARSLSLIARSMGEAFYSGELAEALCAASAAGGGALVLADLRDHRCEWVEPISTDYRGYSVHEIPPNGQGIAALVALAVLEKLQPADFDPDSAEALHLQVEAVKVGLRDAEDHVAEPSCAVMTPAQLLDPARIDDLASRIDLKHASTATAAPRGSETVYLAAADCDGMAVSFIQSNYKGFGSGVVVPGTGIALHNRGVNFVTTVGHPNQVGPGKRPRHTILPGFITRGDKAVGPFGVMGGSMQPQGQVQLVARMLGAGQNPQAAIDAPRWRAESGALWVEDAMTGEVRAGLEALGHRLCAGSDLDFGAAQIVHRLGDGWLAASEPRRDGCAVGF